MSSYRGLTCHRLDRHGIFMTASLDFAESQCIRSERHVTSCRGGRVELVVWLAQMVPAMPSILGDHSRIRTGRIWRGGVVGAPPRAGGGDPLSGRGCVGLGVLSRLRVGGSALGREV